jgi:hypothetical protein
MRNWGILLLGTLGSKNETYFIRIVFHFFDLRIGVVGG